MLDTMGHYIHFVQTRLLVRQDEASGTFLDIYSDLLSMLQVLLQDPLKLKKCIHPFVMPQLDVPKMTQTFQHPSTTCLTLEILVPI